MIRLLLWRTAFVLASFSTIHAAEVQARTAQPSPSGELQVSVRTVGKILDTDGYWVETPGLKQHIDAKALDTVVLSRLPAGELTIILTGHAEDCSVEGGNTQKVTISRDSV